MMAELDWDEFTALPGDATRNWELLCRELVRRNYSQYGLFKSVQQQPGVEFHLKLRLDCSLGDASRHWGWQCRWYDLQPGSQIGKRRREKIIDAIGKTKQYVPTITDWVLWTRRRLTPADQNWFYGLNAPFTLHHWSEEDVVGHLTGDASVLRATYFGELVLTLDRFQRMHEVAIAPVKQRWEPALHVEVDTEVQLKSAFGVPGAWPAVKAVASKLSAAAQSLKSSVVGLRTAEALMASDASSTLEAQSQHLNELSAVLDRGSISTARVCTDNAVRPQSTFLSLTKLAVTLRSVRHPASIALADALGAFKSYYGLLNHLSNTLEENFVAVIGDAGFGKTYLSAQLTQPIDDRHGGILLLAKYLHKGGTLDVLASRLPFGGSNMEQLLEAVDAAGARLDRRIPIFIDGLNESQNPREWKDLLETLRTMVKRTSNCTVVVTLRSAIADEVLPDGIRRLHLAGFEYNAEEALHTYFSYYKIDATDAQLPWHQLHSPLFLSLFCQATNPDRKEVVGVDRIPKSLTAVFEAYREVVLKRAALSLNLAQRDVGRALENVARTLWEQNARSLDFDKLRELVGDSPREWASSLARTLEEEGILSRGPQVGFLSLADAAEAGHNQVSAILYDAFAGFVIADAILSQQSQGDIVNWMKNNWHRLSSSESACHPLSEDVLSGLVGLMPHRFQCQLWTVSPPAIRERALLETVHLDPERLDHNTYTELVTLFRKPPSRRDREPFFRLWSTRGAVQHPLNSEFLHVVLSGMGVAERDLRWSEWLRYSSKDISADLKVLEVRWSRSEKRNDRDRLLARWVMWTLTCTVRNLRDQATKTLYTYGLQSPRSLFEMAVEACSINDPYVSERALAAAYGVTMRFQNRPSKIADDLGYLLSELAIKVTGASASTPTSHWVARTYIQGIVDFARTFCHESVPDGMTTSNGTVLFCPAVYITHQSVTARYDGHIGHDFENYEVGRLFSDRRNYQNDHQAFSQAITEIRGRIWQLGYRQNDFEMADKDIQSDYRRRLEPGRTERYVKKYGWVGYYEEAGKMADDGLLDSRSRSDHGIVPDIDPSFPEVPPNLELRMPSWNGKSEIDNQEWLASGAIEVPDELLCADTIDGEPGAWVAVKGFLEQTDKVLGRQTFGFIRGLLVPTADVSIVISLLQTEAYLGNDFIPAEPSDHYTYAGEIPWSDNFADSTGCDAQLGLYKGRVGNSWDVGPIVEILSHHFAWEDYHSEMNRAGGCSVASKRFSQHYGLRSRASRFDQVDAHGNLAAMTRSPPSSCDRDGSILFIREDLLRDYMASFGLELVIAVWGERHLINFVYNTPEWSQKIYQNHLQVWRRITTLSELRP